jgi:uncharacterized damage-inducible protein DinB
MKHLFQYNWTIRDEWFEALEQVAYEELVRERVGGVGSVLKTLFHIVDVEYSWIQAIMGNEVPDPNFENYQTLDSVLQLSKQYRNEIINYVNDWSSEKDFVPIKVPWSDDTYYCGEVMRHVIAHEIHHIGQLSVWAREIGIKPVSPNFINKGLLR